MKRAKRVLRIFGGVVGLALCAGFAPAKGAPPAEPPPKVEEKATRTKLKAILASEHPRYGDVPVPAAGATLHLGKAYYFLGGNEAKNVLVEAWGNPPDDQEDVVGLVIPAGKTFLDRRGAIVTWAPYEKGVSREEAEAEFERWRKGEAEGNDWLRSNGFQAAHLVGWVQPPAYDAAAHTAIWARRLHFEGSEGDTLNYEVRVLGRDGVLSLNIVADMADLPEVRASAQDLAHAVTFDSAARNADAQPASRKPAGATEPAKNPGLAVLDPGFAGYWVILILGIAAGFAVRLLMRLRDRSPPVQVAPPPRQASSSSIHDFGSPAPSHDFGRPAAPPVGEPEKEASD